MGRRYEFEVPEGEADCLDKLLLAATTAGLSARHSVTSGWIEILIDGSHDDPAVKAFESNMPVAPYLVELQEDPGPQLIRGLTGALVREDQTALVPTSRKNYLAIGAILASVASVLVHLLMYLL